MKLKTGKDQEQHADGLDSNGKKSQTLQSKKRFSVEEIKNILSELKNLNDCKLKEIELTKDGKVISISEEMLNEWSFLGLSNTSFVEMEFWKEK